MLDAIAGGTMTLLVIAGFSIGARLLVIGAKTRGIPELSLGTGLFLIVGIGMPLQMVSLGLSKSGSSPVLTQFAAVSSFVAMNTGWGALWVFTWRVFRNDSTVARFVAYAAFVLLTVLCTLAVLDGLRGMAANIESSLGRALAAIVQALVIYTWTAAEAITWWRRTSRRAALGLADPVVANRFFLWASIAIFSIVSMMAPLVMTLSGVNFQEHAPSRLLVAVSGLGSAVAIWLAFMPPRWYTARIRSGEAEAPGAA